MKYKIWVLALLSDLHGRMLNYWTYNDLQSLYLQGCCVLLTLFPVFLTWERCKVNVLESVSLKQGSMVTMLSQDFVQKIETWIQNKASNAMNKVWSELLLVGWMMLQPVCMHVCSTAERLAWQRTMARYLSIFPCSSISSATSSLLQRCEEARDHYRNPS